MKYRVPWSVPNFQKQDIDSVKRVLDTGWLSMGPEVKRFERMVSSYLKTKHAVAVNNGTAAVDVALKCVGIKQGDEVIVPAFTYIATANAVKYNQGIPVYVDIDDTLNMDPALVEDAITSRTRAILNIDYGGNPSDYDELLRLSRAHDIPLVVDGAQSFGSEYHKKKCCTHGVVNTTSFHQAKILTTIEGGMVFTDDKTLCERARCIRNQGQTKRYVHTYLGNNYRMVDVIAGMGTSQMMRIKTTLKERRDKAFYYRELLEDVVYPYELKDTKNSFFLFLVLVDDRDELNKYLNRNGVETRIYYPLDEQPIAMASSEMVISLPLFDGLTRGQQDYVIKKINLFNRKKEQA